MSRKCVMCGAAQPAVDTEISTLEQKVRDLENKNTELSNAIEEAKKAETKEESDSIFDRIFD